MNQQESVPSETFTSVRCVRSASDAQSLVKSLLPTVLADNYIQRQDETSLKDAIQLHPLAAHVPLWHAHILRLVDASKKLAKWFPECWGKHVWSVEQVLASDAVTQLWQEAQAMQELGIEQVRASLRIRPDGTSIAVIAPLHGSSTLVKQVRIDRQPTFLERVTVSVKTDLRAEYEASRKRVSANLSGQEPESCFDVLLWTESHEEGTGKVHRYLTESSIANIVVQVSDNQWLTPRFQNLLPGMLIQELVRSGSVTQAPLDLGQVLALVSDGAQLWLANAVRGLFPIELIE